MMKIIKDAIKLEVLKGMADNSFGSFVKAVVDVEKEIMAIDGELHSDCEALLLENGSKQKDLWGINLYVEEEDSFIEYDSMINVKPSQNNRSRGVDDSKIKEKIKIIVDKLVER